MATTNIVSSDFGQNFSKNFSKLWLPVPAHMLAHEPEVGQLWKLGKRTLNPKHQTLHCWNCPISQNVLNIEIKMMN